jgi:glycine cleavage system aminomethyltransferase T/glycine/D-amino acid oxidase-like deaminating enzyme
MADGATTTRVGLPERAQVVIIGGGVTGCSIAYHLAHLGWTDVVVLERHALTAGTTWHAAGLITSAGMTDETSLFLSRYSRDLYERLELETGLSTGFRAVGHLNIARTPQRLEALKRSSAWTRGFGVPEHEISTTELADMWPLFDVTGVRGAFYVPDEGRADPVGVATSLARGASNLGVAILEGISVTGVETKNGRVTAVDTDQGRIETEIVVNAAGMWARELGALNGVNIPLQAAEHYYLITDTVPGMSANLPVIEDQDRYAYFRPEGDGMLVGLFEPKGAAWSLNGVPKSFSFGTIAPDWERMEPYLETALSCIPSVAELGVRTLFCGPESFTPDLHPLLGPAPEIDGYFVAAGLNSLGILQGGGVGTVMAHWIVDGFPPVDITGYAIDRAARHESSRRFRAERTVEQLGASFGDSVWPTWKPSTARGIRRTPLHDRMIAAGAHFATAAGWEFAEWFDPDGTLPAPRQTFERQEFFGAIKSEHQAVREGVGIMDMSMMAKIRVQGSAATAVLNRVSTANIDREIGRVVYTQWLNSAGGIVADVTVTRLADDDYLVVAGEIIQRRIEQLIRSETRTHESVVTFDATSATALLTVQGPKSRALISRLTDADLSNEVFPYLSARNIHVGYAPVLAARVTYLGELGWELHVPNEYAVGLYDDLMATGADLGVRPVGLGAMSSLRLEKGYRDMGVDIDSTDNPIEAGLSFTVAWDKPGGFVGREALLAAKAKGAPTDRLVSVVVPDPTVDLFGNEPVTVDGQWVGYVRAAAFGHTLGGPVGLAIISHAGGVTADWLGKTDFRIRTPYADVPATLQVDAPYDPQRIRILAEQSLEANR